MKFFLLNVFGVDGKSGNQLAVVILEEPVEAERMQSIAAEFNFSETVFIENARGAPSLRIFTPREELPFAGHPTVGAAWVLGRLRAHSARPFLVSLKIGEVEVEATGPGAKFKFPGVPKTYSFEGPLNEIIEQCQIQDAVNVGDIRLINVGPEFLVIPLLRGDALRNARSPIHLGLPLNVYLVYAESDAAYSVRMFSPHLGIVEDAATGSAACALAAFLRDVRGLKSGDAVISQGKEIARPSKILVTWDSKQISVGGDVQLWGEGSLSL